MPVDIAALQRQQDDRIAELVGLHEAGLLTAPDLEHAIQRQRESFQRKLLARLDEEDENRGQQQQQQQQQQQRQRQKQQKSEKNQSGHPAAGAASKQQDAETRLRRALVQARDTGEWNSLENAIDDALGAGLPHSNASVVAAFNFIENQLVEGGKHNHNPSSSAAASASRAAAANQPEDDPASTLRQMFDDNLLSAEEYAQALRRLDEEVKGPGEQQPSSTPLTAQRTPRRDEQRRAARRRGVGAQEEPQKGEPTLAQMFDEISSMYRKGHISSPDFARASHLLAHDDDSLSEPEKQEKRILTEMLRQPQAQPADAITGSDDVEEHSDPSSSPPAPRPHRPSPVKQSIAEAALVRQLSDARGGHMSPAFLKHAINVARRTLDAGHPVVEEAQLLHRRLEEESAELEVGNGVAHPSNSDSVVSTKKLQRLLCGLFAAADFESRGAVPVARMVPVCAIRCPRDGRRWKPSRCLQQLQLHIPAANGTVTPASRPQHPHLPRASPAAASSIARRVRMLQDDDDDDGSEANYAVRGRRPRRNRRADMASRSGGGDPAVGPVEFVLYFTHRWHGGMHTFSSDEVDETLLLMHQAVEQQRLRIAADAAAKLEDATHRLHQADGDSGGSKNEEKHTQRQPEQPTLERVKRTAQGTVPRDGAMSSSLRQLLQVHGLAEHAPTMAALGLLHPADCASLNVDEMIECVPALTIPQVRALYKLAAACRARLRRDQEQQQNDERRANRESNDLPRHRPLEDVSPDTVRSSPVDVKGGWSKSPSPPPALSPHSRRNGGPSSSFSPHALNSANVNSTSDVNRPQRHALPGALNRPTPRRLALTDRPSGGPGGPGGQRTGTSVPNPSSGRSQSRSSPPPQLALTAAHPAQKSPSTMVGPFRSGNRSPVLRKTARDHHTPSLFASNAPYGNGSGTSSGGNNSNRNREAPPPARQHQTTTSPSDEALRTSPTKSANDSVPTVRVASPDTVEGQSAALNHSRGDSSGTGVDLDETLPLDAVPTSSPLYRSSGPAPAWIAHHGQSPFLTSQIHADGADLGGVGSQRTQAPPQSSFSTPSQQQQQQQQQQHSQGREPRPHVSPQQVVYPDDRLHRSGPYHSPDRNQQQQQPQQKAQLPILGVDNSTPPNLMDRAVRTELQNVALRLQAMAHGPLSRAEARELRESVSELQSNTRRYLDSRQNQVHNQNASTNTSSHQSGRGGPNIGDDLSCVPHGSPSTTARGAYGRSASPPPELRPGRSPPSRGRRPPSPPPERSVVADSKPELAASLGSLLSSIHATMSRLGSGEEEGVLSDPLRSSWLTTRDLLPDDDDDFEAGTAPADLRELADGLDEILGSVDELHKDAAAAPDLAEQPERPKVSFAPARAFPADPLSTDVAVPYVRPGYIEELERAGYGKQPHEVVVRPWDSAGMGQEPASNQTPNTPVKQQQKNVAQRVAERRAAKVAAARFTPAGGPGTPDLAATGGPGSRGYKSPELQAGKSKPTETKSVNDMVDDVLKSSDDEDDSSSLTSADTRDGEGDEANDRRGDKSASSSASSGEDSEDEEWRRKFKRQDKRLSITKLKQVGRKISPKRGQIREKAKRLEAQGENVVKKHAKKKARKKKRGSDEYSSSSDGESSGSEPDPFTLEKQLEKELGSDKFAVAPVVASPPANGGQSPDDIGQEGSLQHETSQQHQLFYLQYVCKNLDGCGIFELPSYDAGLPRNRRGENTIRQQEIVSAVEEVSGWLKLGDGRGWVPVVSQGGTTVNFVPLHEDEEGVAKDQRPDFETVAVQAIRERAKTVEDAIALEVERDQAVRKQNKHRAEVAYLKYREETEKMELDLEALETKLEVAKRKNDKQRATRLRGQIRDLQSQIEKHTRTYKQKKREAEELLDKKKALARVQLRAMQKTQQQIQDELKRIKKEAAAARTRLERERKRSKRAANKRRLRLKLQAEADRRNLAQLVERRRSVAAGQEEGNVQELDNQIRLTERALRDHQEGYLQKKKERDELTKVPLWIAVVQRGLRRIGTPRNNDLSTDEEESASGSEDQQEGDEAQNLGTGAGDGDQESVPPTPPPRKRRHFFAVGMLAEVELPPDTVGGAVWEPCKIRAMEVAPSADGQEGERTFTVVLENRAVLAGIPEPRLRPLSPQNALLIDPSVFSDNDDEDSHGSSGSDSEAGGSESDSSSGEDSSHHSHHNQDESVPRQPVPSRPPPQPQQAVVNTVPGASPFDAFYAQLPDIRARIRAVGTPRGSEDARNTNIQAGSLESDSDDEGLAALERVHASLDRMNSEVRATTPLPSYDETENRADRLERLQEEMDLSRRDVRLNASSAGQSLTQIDGQHLSGEDDDPYE